MSPSATLPQLYSYEYALDMDRDRVGMLRESADAEDDFTELKRRLDEDGYLFMKGYLDRDEVLAARAEIARAMASKGVLDPDFSEMDMRCRPGALMEFMPEVAAACPRVQSALFG